MGQRRTVAAGPRLDSGLVQSLGDTDWVPAGQVERDQRGAPGRVLRPVDGDPVDGPEPVERPAGQRLVPRGDAVHGGPDGVAFRLGDWDAADAAALEGLQATGEVGRGMVDDDFESAFTSALALDDQRPMPFERARTLLAFGRRLHRARRRAEARDRLREARHGFEQLRAGAWAAHAGAELHTAGARRRREPDDSALTAQELRVAAAV